MDINEPITAALVAVLVSGVHEDQRGVGQLLLAHADALTDAWPDINDMPPSVRTSMLTLLGVALVYLDDDCLVEARELAKKHAPMADAINAMPREVIEEMAEACGLEIPKRG